MQKRSFWRDNGLSLTVFGCFLVFVIGQTLTGWHDTNNEALLRHEATLSLGEYVQSGDYFEALFENWESEFLQMGAYIVLTAFLFQRGSKAYSDELKDYGHPPVSPMEYLSTARFWFESLQNWQSEFLAVFAIVVLSIWLRQQGSPESKPVFAPHLETGSDG